MPIPVSLTEISISQIDARPIVITRASGRRPITTTSPVSVNLTALLSRLSRIWRTRFWSPTKSVGVPASITQASLQALLGGRGRHDVQGTFDAGAELERPGLELEPAGLDLGEVENVVDDLQQRVAAVADGDAEVALLGGRARYPAAAATCR